MDDGFYKKLAYVLEIALEMECQECGVDSEAFKGELSILPAGAATEEALTCGSGDQIANCEGCR